MELPKVQEEIGNFLQKLEEQKGLKPPPKKAAEKPKATEKPKTLSAAQVMGLVAKQASEAEPTGSFPSLSACPYEKFEEVKDFLLDKKKAGKPFNLALVANKFQVKYDDTFKHLWTVIKQEGLDIGKEMAKADQDAKYAVMYEAMKECAKPKDKVKTYADLDSLDQAEILTFMAKLISEGTPYANVLAEVMDIKDISYEGLKAAYDQAEAAVKAFKEKAILEPKEKDDYLNKIVEEAFPGKAVEETIMESKETTDEAITEYVKDLLSYGVETNYQDIEVTVLQKFPLLHPSNNLTMLIKETMAKKELKPFGVTLESFKDAAKQVALAKKKAMVETFLGLPKPPTPKHFKPFMEQLEVVFEALEQTFDSPFVPPAIVIWHSDDGLFHFQAMPEGLGVAEPPPGLIPVPQTPSELLENIQKVMASFEVVKGEGYSKAVDTQAEMLEVVKQNHLEHLKLLGLQTAIFDEIKDAVVKLAGAYEALGQLLLKIPQIIF